MKVREDFTITEKARTSACSKLTAPSSTFKKTLLRHYAKQVLTHISRLLEYKFRLEIEMLTLTLYCR